MIPERPLQPTQPLSAPIPSHLIFSHMKYERLWNTSNKTQVFVYTVPSAWIPHLLVRTSSCISNLCSAVRAPKQSSLNFPHLKRTIPSCVPQRPVSQLSEYMALCLTQNYNIIKDNMLCACQSGHCVEGKDGRRGQTLGN